MRLDRLAFLISALGSPFIVVPAFGLVLIRLYSRSRAELLLMGLLFVLTIVLLPAGYIAWSVWRGRFTDVHVRLREQRSRPFMVATAGAAILAAAYGLLRAPLPITGLALVLVANGVTFFVLTGFRKVSMHTASYTAAVITCIVLVDPLWSALLLALPAIVWARIRRGRHTLGDALVAVAGVMPATLLTLRALGLW